jgi:urease accessory protein
MTPGMLRLFQLVSPALPVGAFSYSEGLEALVQQGMLGTAAVLGNWLEAELARGTVAIEAAALSHLREGFRADRESVADLDGWLLALREAPEMRAQQRQMGRSLLQLLAELGWPLPEEAAMPLGWPAAWAWAGFCLEIPPTDLTAAYLYGWIANQVSAAVRLIPLGPTQGQRLQLALAPLITARAEALTGADPRLLWSGGVGAGMAQLQHAELYSRLFRS